MTLEVDAFGNVTKSATIGYSRRTPVFPEQATTLMTYSEADFINRADVEDFYRIGVPSETRTYEITGVGEPQAGNTFFTVPAILAQLQNAGDISYEMQPTAGVVQRRLIEHTQTLYYKDDLSGPLPLGQVESHALPYQTYKEALTPGLVTQVYGNRVNDALLTGEGGYIQQNGAWWVPSARSVPDAGQFYQPVQVIDPLGNTSTITYDAHALLMIQTEDPLKNVVQARNNYRTMLPELVTEPNGNRSAVLFDALGMVVETVVMGKETEQLGDTLAAPTSRLEYNLLNWQQNQLPNYVHTSAREQHGAANPRWQETYSYSDGSGHEVMKKIQAEPGPALTVDAQGNLKTVNTSPQVRWVGTGRTIYDNNGNPVKKYEPYFSVTFAYETEQVLVELGVTPILHYDPLGRLIRTDNPDGTFSRVEFDAWQQITSDENDTVVESQWYVDRGSPKPADPEPTDPETRACWLAAHHANTPAIAHLDVLGRTFLTIADNGPDGKYQTHVKLDIEGNQLVITDARGNQAMVNTFDILKRKLYMHSVDAGQRWILHDVVDLPMREWDSQAGDSQAHQLRHSYDALHRPTHLFVQQGINAEVLAERIVYGEALPNAATLNRLGKLYQHYDGAGVVTNTQYDFKGNLLRSNRQLAREYRQQVDWSPLANLTNPQDIANAAAPLLETETFTSSTTYDALNRSTSLTMPDQSVVIPTYNEANLLEKLDVRLRSAANATTFVKNLDYNAKGQRELLEYNNNVSTAYTYDPFTFRLTNLKTTRTTDNTLLQDLGYTYDPVGNITETRDGAQQTIFFNNAVVSPATHYIYDALYWLTQATGREHVGQTGTPPPNYAPEYDYNDAFRVNLPHPNDGQAMQNYTEQYQYDSVGNIISMAHQATGNIWTRRYAYAPDSNRLQSTSLPGDAPTRPFSAPYSYDIHGNMTKMHHLPQLQWDFKNQLHQVDLGGGGTAYYVYDASGQRVRKIVETGSLTKERIYLDGYEIFRQRNGSSLTLQRETLHVMDDKQRIALVETQTIDGGNPVASPTSLLRYQLGNHLSSAVLELDASGAIISYEEYYPYGSTSYQAGRNAAEVSLKRYRYTSKERDEETGLYYHGVRYYVVWLGRWLSCDSVLDHPNLYVYCSNSPIRFLDPNGAWQVDMHFFMVYWTGRMSHESHDTALRVALASQMPDEPVRLIERRGGLESAAALDAPGLKSRHAVSTEYTGLADMLHSLGHTRGDAEKLAQYGIERQDLTIFGLGLHAVGDYLPHGNTSGIWTFGHGWQYNEDGSISTPFTTTADQTYRNPRKAEATSVWFMQLWGMYRGRDPEFPSATNMTFIKRFVRTESFEEKKNAFMKWIDSQSDQIEPSVRDQMKKEFGQVWDMMVKDNGKTRVESAKEYYRNEWSRVGRDVMRELSRDAHPDLHSVHRNFFNDRKMNIDDEIREIYTR